MSSFSLLQLIVLFSEAKHHVTEILHWHLHPWDNVCVCKCKMFMGVQNFI